MTTPLLKLTQLAFRLPFRDQPLIQAISYEIFPGDFVVLLGSNGSGKSTLIKLINRTYRQRQGEIDFNGQNILELPRKKLARMMMTLTQSTTDSLFDAMTVAENGLLWEMRMCGTSIKTTKQARIRALTDYLAPFHLRLTERLHTPVNRLSGGERQILVLALCLRYQPQLLLLDEHTSALDPKTAEKMMAQTYHEVTKRKVTCIMTTHNLDFAQRYGNRLLAIHDGQIIHDVSGAQKQQLTRQQLLEDCYR